MSACQPPSAINDWTEELRLMIADSLFNNLSEGICITDAHERIIEVNPTYCQITGYGKDELLGKTPRALSSGLQNAAFFAAMWTELLEAGEWHGELWNRNKSGQFFAVRLNISAIHNASGIVTNYLAIMADITAEKVRQDEWERHATHDHLTGLPNRLLLIDRLHQAIAQSKRTGLLLAVCYLDLDGFKPVNDSCGHKSGDAVLVEIGKRLQDSVREGDTVARVGGDEFVLLLWGLGDIPECRLTLDRVIADIDRPILIDQIAISVTISVGVTIFPQDGDDPALLTAQADSAMYRSKMSGGNRYTFF